MNYKDLYYKYKEKYLYLKGGESNTESSSESTSDTNLEFRNRDVDWFLFFDLWQVSRDILNITKNTDIIILIGDTPSYLMPILNLERKVHHFASSLHAFGCVIPPSAAYSPKQDAWWLSPKYNNLELYFNYLDTKTELTRDYMEEHWNDIILVDFSSGRSIHGISIFFNRYVGNINKANDQEFSEVADCTNIIDAKPLQFIQLVDVDNMIKFTNLMPENLPNKTIRIVNYRPDLIIRIGSSIFSHVSLFTTMEAYPRLIPSYSVYAWNKPPNEIHDESKKYAIENFKKLELMTSSYIKLKTGKKLEHTEINVIKTIDPVYSNSTLSENKLLEHLDEINKNMLITKFYQYFAYKMQ